MSDALVQQTIVEEVLLERTRQDEMFGAMPRNLTPAAWLTILVEEIGEVARASIEGDSTGYPIELIQVAAVAIAALEDYYGGRPDLHLEDVCRPIYYAQCVPKTSRLGTESAS